MNNVQSDWIKIYTQNCWYSLKMKSVKLQIRKNTPDVVCLQEISLYRNIAGLEKFFPEYKVLSSDPFNVRRGFKFRNVIMSRLPVVSRGEITFNLNSPKKPQGKVLWVTLRNRNISVRIYNCHLAAFGLGMEERAYLLKNIIYHALKFKGPILIAGDMNTGTPANSIHRKIVKIWTRNSHPDKNKIGKLADANEKYYFAAVANELGFAESFDLKDPTFRIIKQIKKAQLKLDWIFYKKLIVTKTYFGPYIGDHRGLYASFNIS